MNDQYEDNTELRGVPRSDAPAPLSHAAPPSCETQFSTPSQFAPPPCGSPHSHGAESYPFAGGQPPYRGGIPVRCPRCGNIIVTPVCGFCGSDLSQIYTFNGQALPAPGHLPAYANCPPPRPVDYPPAQPYANPYQAAPYPPPHRREKNRFVWIAIGLTLLVLLIAASGILAFSRMTHRPTVDNPILNINPGGYPGSDAPQNYFAPYGVSPAEYRQIKKGMSYALISQIIGGDGQLVDPSDPAAALKSDYVIYGWPGELDTNASLYIEFVEGRAVEITAKGLDK